MKIKWLLGTFILSNILASVTFAKGSVYAPLFKCAGDKWECSNSTFTSDGLAFLNYKAQLEAGKVQSLQIHLSKRKKTGWSTQSYVVDIASYALDRLTSISLSNDAARVIIHGYQITNTREKKIQIVFWRI